MTKESVFRPASGWFPLFLFLAIFLPAQSGCYLAASLAGSERPWLVGACITAGVVCAVIGLIGLFGCIAVPPNEARVLLLFGDYRGSVHESGFYWVNPFYSKKKISLRVRNFETGSSRTPEKKDDKGHVVQAHGRTHGRPSKVNDREGNPIEISAVVVWRVVNTVEALFEVDDYEDFVAVQSEAALRSLASRHPYDSEDHQVSLRGNTTQVCEELRHDIQERLDKAGVQVIEARLSHLAYSPEIAAAMLQRQQAQAIIAARTKIVDGAVGMVDMALKRLSHDKIVDLDPERRAQMVSNLMVVLCGNNAAQPIVNTGTLY
jgi:regulator of protease activity HflC (stomatin/prohibitin superfamily)